MRLLGYIILALLAVSVVGAAQVSPDDLFMVQGNLEQSLSSGNVQMSQDTKDFFNFLLSVIFDFQH